MSNYLFKPTAKNHEVVRNGNYLSGEKIESVVIHLDKLLKEGELKLILLRKDDSIEALYSLNRGGIISQTSYDIFDESLDTKNKFLGILELAKVDMITGRLITLDAILAGYEIFAKDDPSIRDKWDTMVKTHATGNSTAVSLEETRRTLFNMCLVHGVNGI